MKMRALGISTISLAMTAAVVSNAYYQKKQFYPSVVYITKSNSSMTVIYIQSLILVLMLGKLTKKIFLGTLRAAEFEHLMERFWYALTETCLAFTVFRDDFNPKFVAMFTVLLFLKSFHWLAEDRVDYMERSPVIGWLFYIRVSALLTFLGILDYMMISHAYHFTMAKGATVQLVFGFEYAVLITMVANTTIKYVLHAAEMRADSPWENKAVFLLYTELVIGFIRVVLYILFVVIMVKIYTLPLFAFRPMYYTMRNFKKAFNDVILSRRAIRNMNTLYPDATPEELSQSDNICIICREDMVNNAKKLPCGHIFHTACLRSWFQRQQTCPTCRLNILRTTPPTPTRPVIEPVQNNDQMPQNPANVNNLHQAAVNPFANLLAQPVLPMPNVVGGVGGVPPMPPNASAPFATQFPMYPPYMVPPPVPPIPQSLENLTDEELRAIEGNERKHVEARIKLLRNIHTLLDASVALMNQYSIVASRYVPPPTIDPSTSLPIPTTTSSAERSTNALFMPTTSSTLPNLSNETIDSDQPCTSSQLRNEIAAQCNDIDEADKFVKIEDIGSEEHIDLVSTNSTISKEATSFSPPPPPPPIVESSEAAELRRRRLQKFSKTSD